MSKLLIWGTLVLAALPAGAGIFNLTTSEPDFSWEIEDWRTRQKAEQQDPIQETELSRDFAAFRKDTKIRLLEEVLVWVQEKSNTHYVADADGDQWATLTQTLNQNGDDCDGLELLSYDLLTGLGFAEDELYRAVIYRPEDGAYHMVTVWFDQSDENPWVVDPTGFASTKLVRLSELTGWEPVRYFNMKGDMAV